MTIIKGVTSQMDVPASAKPILLDEAGRLLLGAGVALSLAPTSIRSAADIVRPANVTPYTANDVVGGVLTFAAVSTAAGYIYINGVDLRYDAAAIPTGMTTFRLHLYSVTPPSAFADNAAWDLPAGDRASYIGYIDIGAIVDLGSTLYVSNDTITALRKLGVGETALYAYLVTIGGYTPAANSETARVTLRGLAGI